MFTSFHVFIESVDVVTEIFDVMLLCAPAFKSSLKPVKAALIATPIKIMRNGLSPDFQENIYTSIKAHAPPMNANRGVQKNNVGNKDIITIDINADPDETPIMPGSANGLRMTA